MKRKTNFHRWFGLSLLIILLMSSWVNSLYDDISDVKFTNEIQEIYLKDKDSVNLILLKRIDSLKVKDKVIPINIKPVHKHKPIVDSIKLDSILIPSKIDSIINNTDTIRQ